MVVPMLFVYLPCAGIINLPMLGFRINVFPNIISAATTFFPLIDAFVLLFGIKSYRWEKCFLQCDYKHKYRYREVIRIGFGKCAVSLSIKCLKHVVLKHCSPPR